MAFRSLIEKVESKGQNLTKKLWSKNAKF